LFHATTDHFLSFAHIAKQTQQWTSIQQWMKCHSPASYRLNNLVTSILSMSCILKLHSAFHQIRYNPSLILNFLINQERNTYTTCSDPKKPTIK